MQRLAKTASSSNMLERWIAAHDAQGVLAADRLDVFADDGDRREQGLVRAGIAGDLAVQPLALAGQHAAHALQLENERLDLLHRSLDQPAKRRMHVLGI